MFNFVHIKQNQRINIMNKLLMTLEFDFADDIVLIANNHKDLEDYLIANYNWHSVDVKEDAVLVKESEGYETDIATLQWVKHI